MAPVGRRKRTEPPGSGRRPPRRWTVVMRLRSESKGTSATRGRDSSRLVFQKPMRGGGHHQRPFGGVAQGVIARRPARLPPGGIVAQRAARARRATGRQAAERPGSAGLAPIGPPCRSVLGEVQLVAGHVEDA